MSKTDTENAKQEIAQAVRDAIKLLSTAAQEAARKIANDAAIAAKVVDTKHADDHDMIVRLDTKMDLLSTDIRDLKDGITKRIDNLEKEKLNICDSYFVLYKKEVETKLENHEIRIKSGEITDARLIAYGTALVFILSFAQWLVGKYL